MDSANRSSWDDPARQEHNEIDSPRGFPDFPAPDSLKEAAARAIREEINQYAITWGAHHLRDALARNYARWYGMDVIPNEITVTCGATEAIISRCSPWLIPGMR